MRILSLKIMEIIIIEHPIKITQVQEMAHNQFGDLIKATVDVKRRIIALGGDLHCDEEALLLEHGSTQANLWGINIYPLKNQADWIEFDSMINIRPNDNNMSRDVEDAAIREIIVDIVHTLIQQ